MRKRNIHTLLVIAGMVLLGVSWSIHYIGRESWNATSRFLLVYSLGEEGSCRIDRRHGETGDKVYFGGHYYSDKAPGLALAAVPAWLAWKNLGADGEKFLRYLTTLSTLGAGSVLGALVFWKLLGLLGWAAGRWRAALTLGWALGSPAWPFATVFQSHQAAALALLGSFYLAVRARTGKNPGGFPLSALGGAAAGAAVLLEYPAALAALILTIYAWLPPARARRRLFWAAGAAIPLGALLLYHYLCFGSPWETGYSHHYTYDHSGGILGIGFPAPGALYGITFSTYRGIFFSSPYLLMAIPGAWFLLRGKRRLEAGVCLALLLAHVGFNAGFAYWDGVGSYTARHLVCVVPFAALLAAGVKRPWRDGAVLLILLSIVFMFVVVATEPRAEWRVKSPLFYFNFHLFSRGLISDNLFTLLGWGGRAGLWALGIILGGGLVLLGRINRGFFPDRLSYPSWRNGAVLLAAVASWIVLIGWQDPPRREFDRIESLFRYGRSRDAVDWAEVEARYFALALAEPSYPEPLGRLAEIALSSGRYRQAAAWYEHLLTLTPGDRESILTLAALYGRLGQAPKGRELLERLIAFDPGYAPAYGQMVLLEVNSGRPAQARAWLEKTKRLESRNPFTEDQLEELERALN